MSGDIDMAESQTLTRLRDPTGDKEAANKNYVDSSITEYVNKHHKYEIKYWLNTRYTARGVPTAAVGYPMSGFPLRRNSIIRVCSHTFDTDNSGIPNNTANVTYSLIYADADGIDIIKVMGTINLTNVVQVLQGFVARVDRDFKVSDILDPSDKEPVAGYIKIKTNFTNPSLNPEMVLVIAILEPIP